MFCVRAEGAEARHGGDVSVGGGQHGRAADRALDLTGGAGHTQSRGPGVHQDPGRARGPGVQEMAGGLQEILQLESSREVMRLE